MAGAQGIIIPNTCYQVHTFSLLSLLLFPPYFLFSRQHIYTCPNKTLLKEFLGKIPWRRKWQPTPVFSPGKYHGQRSLVGYTVHGVAKSQTRLSNTHTHTHTFLIKHKVKLLTPPTGKKSKKNKYFYFTPNSANCSF